MEISSDRDFLGPTSSYVLIQYPVRRLCHRMIAYSIFGRGQAPEKACRGEEERIQAVRRHFIGRLYMHFGLVTDKGLRGLQSGQATEEDAQEIPAPAQAPPPPLPAKLPNTMSQRIEEEVHDLQRDVVGLRGVVERLLPPKQSRTPPGRSHCYDTAFGRSGQILSAIR
ncbi:hypothetical protein Tco_0644844 [Tanacetum coccineum]